MTYNYDLLIHKLTTEIMAVTANTAQATAFISVWCDPDKPDTNSDGQPFIFCELNEFGGIVNRAQMMGLTCHAMLREPV